MYTIYVHIHQWAIKCTCRFISRLIMDTTKDSKYYLKHSKLHGYKQAGIGNIPGIELEAPLFQIFCQNVDTLLEWEKFLWFFAQVYENLYYLSGHHHIKCFPPCYKNLLTSNKRCLTVHKVHIEVYWLLSHIHCTYQPKYDDTHIPEWSNTIHCI